jgi:flagella basal body P-ring formation protein FlgA
MPLKLRRSVAAGQPITPADVASVPMVARGSTARLRSVQGPIALETPVEVLEDGAQGQTIRVKLPKASSSVQAQVTGPGLVEIRE